MSQTLFISDLHLNADEPATVARFEAFCRDVAPGADAVYILGDFFEYWAGDDDASPDVMHSVTSYSVKIIKTYASSSDKGGEEVSPTSPQ
jgi:UDP-2,3-diacylglucosamine pyrophosphatase LpxH